MPTEDSDQNRHKNGEGKGPLSSNDPVAELITEFCYQGNHRFSAETALQVAQFVVELFIDHHEQDLRQAEFAGLAVRAQETHRRVALARTLRKKVARLRMEM